MYFENAAKNATASIICRVVEQLLAFVSRTVFIHFLTVEYLGITSLFSNILNVLNLAELGVGTAINVALYAPLAVDDREKIKSLMRLYKKAYFFIGLAVLVIGCVLIPFLPYMMKGTTDLVNIQIVYMIYIAKSVISYWLYAYKRSLFEADQKSYLVSFISYAIICLWKIVQISFLFILRETPQLSFYVYCAGDVFCSIVINLAISRKANKQYPFINEHNSQPLLKEEKKALFKNVYGVALYKISSTINKSADSIIISGFIGTAILGLYSNYLLILNAIIKIIGLAFNSITATVGNINALETVEKKYSIFKYLQLVYFWVYGFCFICLWVLLNPFVSGIWLGEDYRLSELIVFTMCLNTLVDGLMGSSIMFRNACGLYWQSRYRAVATVIINVSLSIMAVTVFDWGIAGVLLATIISRLAVTLWVDTCLVFKHVMNTSPKQFFLNYFCSLLLVVTTGALIKLICSSMPEKSAVFFAIRVLFCIVIPNYIWWVIFRRTNEFIVLKKTIKKMFKKYREEGKV